MDEIILGPEKTVARLEAQLEKREHVTALRAVRPDRPPQREGIADGQEKMAQTKRAYHRAGVMYARGFTNKAISEELGVCTDTVSRWIASNETTLEAISQIMVQRLSGLDNDTTVLLVDYGPAAIERIHHLSEHGSSDRVQLDAAKWLAGQALTAVERHEKAGRPHDVEGQIAYAHKLLNEAAKQPKLRRLYVEFDPSVLEEI